MPSATDWLAALSPWPEEFGLDRMRGLLADLGDPQQAFPSVHVVGTNGKSSTTRLTAALLRDAGLRVGAYTSPHVAGWHERLDTDEAGFERAVARVRPAATRLGATQFEALTAAALADFAERKVDVAVVEAGLGGRLDATNVLRSPVVVLTNVGLEHTEQLGETREEIAAEKLAVVQPGGSVVLCEPEWEALARSAGAGATVLTGRSNLALAVAAAETFLGRPVDPGAADDVQLPGRLERRGEAPLEIWDGAHNLDGIAWLLSRLPDRRYVVVVSILRDKDADGDARGAVRSRRHCGRDRVGAVPRAGRRRSCDASDTMVRESGDGAGPRRGSRARTVDRGRERRRPRHGVAVPPGRPRYAPRRRTIRNRPRVSVFVFAAIVILSFAGIAFAAGYVVGKLLL